MTKHRYGITLRARIPWVGRRILHTVAELVLAIAWGTVLLSCLLGGLLSLAWLGIPLLLASLACARGLAGTQRRLLETLLNRRIGEPRPIRNLPGTRRRLKSLLSAPSTRRALAYGLLRTALALPVAFLLGLLVIAAGFAAVVPFRNSFIINGTWRSSAGAASWWALPLALLLVAIAVTVCVAASAAFASLAPLLAPSSAESLREQLEESRSESRLAAELHDSVGHAITVMVLQAGAARRLLETGGFPAHPHPDEPPGHSAATTAPTPRELMAGIEDQGRAALGGLDSAMAALRGNVAKPSKDLSTTTLPVAGADSQTRPVDPPEQTRLQRLENLAGAVTAAGQPVDLYVRLDLAGLTPAHWDLLWAVTREGLTNAIRHASGAATAVRWECIDNTVTARISTAAGGRRDPGRIGGGRGLAMLEERLMAAGGHLEAGPAPDGRWLLQADLPVRRRPRWRDGHRPLNRREDKAQ
ncbi:sensor domain-containing protein [Streptomyces sp. NPDC055056]